MFSHPYKKLFKITSAYNYYYSIKLDRFISRFAFSMTTYAMEQVTIELVSHRLENCYRVLFSRQVTSIVFELIAMWRHW